MTEDDLLCLAGQECGNVMGGSSVSYLDLWRPLRSVGFITKKTFQVFLFSAAQLICNNYKTIDFTKQIPSHILFQTSGQTSGSSIRERKSVLVELFL